MKFIYYVVMIILFSNSLECYKTYTISGYFLWCLSLVFWGMMITKDLRIIISNRSKTHE